MKIFNISWKNNKLPKETPIAKKDYVQPPLVNPDFYVRNNPKMAAEIQKYDPIKPDQIRRDVRMEIVERVDHINNYVKNNRKLRHLAFSYHEGAGKNVVKVTDSRTGKELMQIPSDTLLMRAEVLRDVSGLLKSVLG